ncbi:alkaline-phosphatase-like protein, partial [Pavlovales sp. CCMP2436]
RIPTEILKTLRLNRCVLFANSTIVQQPVYLHGLSENLLAHATRCMRGAAGRGNPWLHVFADPHPAAPHFSTPSRPPGATWQGATAGPAPSSAGRAPSAREGAYARAVGELDASLGVLLDEVAALEKNGSTKKGWAQAGRGGGLKGGKGQVWEGGLRVPAIVRWPGFILAGGVSSAPFHSLDWLPTLAALARSCAVVRAAPNAPGEGALGGGLTLRLGGRTVRLDGVDQSLFLRTASPAHNAWLANADGSAAARAQLIFCGPRVLGARVGALKVLWATQRWAQPGDAAGGPRGAWAPQVCAQCCAGAGWAAAAPFGSPPGCGCADESLNAHAPELVFDSAADANETRPLGHADKAVARAVRLARAAATEFTRQLGEEAASPCLACVLPAPLAAWPCCAGRSQRAQSAACRARAPAQLAPLLGRGPLLQQARALVSLVHECTAAPDLAYALANLISRSPRGGGRPAAGGVDDGLGADELDLSTPCTCNLCAPGTREGGGLCAGGWD